MYLLKDFDRDLMDFPFFGGTRTQAQSYSPKVDILENQEGYVLRAEVPGFTKDELKIEYHDSVLTLSGQKKTETEVNEENHVHREIKTGKFVRAFKIPGIDADKVSAKLENGIISLSLVKQEEKKTKLIEITQ